jgi:UDP-N-acetylmuramate dehydrogenase
VISSTAQQAIDALAAVFGPDGVRQQVSLAPLTTFHVGGPAELLVEARREEELVAAAGIARQHGLLLTVLGGGSNVLVSDRGVRGLVVLARDRAIAQVGNRGVRAAAGVAINGLVRWTVGRGLAGLEAWAGTPGMVGGAIHGNAHFQGRLIGDAVRSVRLWLPDAGVDDVPAAAMKFGYDSSRLQDTGEVALSAVFDVSPGEPDDLRRTARESLAFRKRTQPLDVPSAGCVFQNPDPSREPVPEGIPPSAGALIDRAGLKGRAIGGARVSSTHGNFIVHDGHATAADIRVLVQQCQDTVATRFGVYLREEIVYLGDF